ncbi:MAG: Gfo/Idh/MocA family oxidoreductase [Clostridia bacterium]|nr:Gfo/Idh/MocA family oxidoreductase [Clostridia bacterium]
MEIVRFGVIGYGQRGCGLLDNLLLMDDVVITAVCDKYEDRSEKAKARVIEKRNASPFASTDYKEILKRDDVDAVLIATDWEMHFPIAIDAMKAGKAVALEVGGAYCIEDCFELVKTWEETKVPFMFMENCCYNREEMLVTEMAKQGKFGKIVYCSGSYSHDLRGEVATGKENRHYRLRNYLNRNCENYPTHELGPIAKILGINRGNRMVSLVSVASMACGMEQYVNDRRDTVNPELIGAKWAQGDIVNTIITCENGETILIRLDTTLPRSYSREFTVRGTKGMYEQQTNSVFFDGQAEYWNPTDFVKNYMNSAEKFKDLLPDCWKNITKEQLDAGHGGMDYIEFREFVTCLKEGKEMPIDVYDAASWMCVSCLSEKSIKEGGAPQAIPDFTNGAYKTR